jgi:ankyrin repeat protein
MRTNLAAKPDVDGRDGRQNTPLLWAAALGSREAVELLLAQGADPNAANAFGITPLIAAATDGAKVKLLLAAGAKPGVKAKSGHHALVVAATSPRATASVEALIEAGAPVNEPGAIAMAPIGAATFFVCGEANVKALLKAGADAKHVNALGYGTAVAATNCSAELIADLLRRGANPNQKNVELGKARHGVVKLRGLTALHLAAAHRDAGTVETLLKHGANVNEADERKMTPLLMAVSSENQDPAVVKLLLAKGADRTAKDELGQDAVAWAKKFNNPATLKLLGAKPAREVAALEAKSGPGAGAAVGLLENAAESFFKESGCIACHHSNLSSFALSRAAQAGMKLDAKLIEARRQRLKGMLASYVPTYLQQVGPPGDIDSALYSLLEARSLNLESSPELELAAKYALSRQLENASFNMRGISRSPIEEGDIHRTALAIWLLPQTIAASQIPELKPRMAEALRWLAAQRAVTNDDMAMQLLGLKWGNASSAEVARAAKTLEAAQREDGGWGGNAHLASDAYSTGMSLFALTHGAGRGAADRSVKKATHFLLHTQKADGSWHVKSRAVKFQPYFESGFPYGHDQWISASATAWALAGLAEARAIQ